MLNITIEDKMLILKNLFVIMSRDVLFKAYLVGTRFIRVQRSVCSKVSLFRQICKPCRITPGSFFGL